MAGAGAAPSRKRSFVEVEESDSSTSQAHKKRCPPVANFRRVYQKSTTTSAWRERFRPKRTLDPSGSSTYRTPPSPSSCSPTPTRSSRLSARLMGKSHPQLHPEDKYLSYYDVNLTWEDIKTLRSNDWLTDNLISFWEEYLERETLPKYPNARISLIRPAMTMILLKDKNLEIVRKQLPDFKGITHIFLPITDASGFTAEGGTHWSLLLISKLDGVAFHYDSLAGGNTTEARQATARMSHVLGRDLQFLNIEDCPQQTNSYDCGVYVCILMRHLMIKRLLNVNYREKVSMSMKDKNIDAHSARKEIIKIIEGMKREGERRRSVSPFSSKSDTPRISYHSSQLSTHDSSSSDQGISSSPKK